MKACGSFRKVFFVEPIAWELKNSKCFFMMLFEFIKKKFTSFRPVSVSCQFVLLRKNWRILHFGKNLIKSVHKGTLEDKIPWAPSCWLCGNSRRWSSEAALSPQSRSSPCRRGRSRKVGEVRLRSRSQWILLI